MNSHVEPETSRSQAQPSRKERFADITFRRAIRSYSPGYSRFVSLAKFALPVVAVVLIGLVVLWPPAQSGESGFRMAFASLGIASTDEPDMLNPRYQGADRNGRKYTITADLARSAVRETDVVDLEQPKADITLSDGTWVVLTAETGVFRRQLNTLELIGGVNVFHDSGYEFRTTRAQINLDEGTAAGSEPVVGQGPFGDLKAEGFRLTDSGRTILFTGRSTLLLYSGGGRRGQ